MKIKNLILTVLAVCAALASSASTTWNVIGTDYTVDTLFHNQVGPGTTTTSLWFHNDAKSTLRVFYCTMDMTNPYLSLAGVCATDKLAGNEKVSAMAERKSEPGKRYFVGVNADFFTTSGTTGRGVSKIGSPVGSTIVDGTIYRARNNATLYKNFVVDTAGQVYTNPFFFGGTITVHDTLQETLGGINVNPKEKAASNVNKVTIYNDLYYGSTDASDGGNEIVAYLLEGEQFLTGAPFKMVVSGAPSTEGDMTIPEGGYVIHGNGTASNFVGNLADGDTVTLHLTWTYNGVSVIPQQIISGNPKILEGGVTLDSEGDRSDANSNQPRAAVGYSDGGDKVYFFVVDGRSTISLGVRTSALADIMRYAGVTDAINVDGGGSACLYTSTLGIRNNPSDGSERSDGNAFYCVSSAPDDDSIASLRFVDYYLAAPRYGMYTPHFYGYNQYGMLVDDDVQGVVLSCPESLGTIVGDTTFYATGEGSDLLTGTLGNVSVSQMMYITSNVDSIKIANDTIINDTFREYAVAVESTSGSVTMPINPQALTWHSTDESIVTIDSTTGVLRGVQDGLAAVIGSIGDVNDTMWVKVEKPTAHAMPIDPDLDVDTWKISLSGGKNGTATAQGDGFSYSFTGSSARVPKITLTKAFRLWSLPDTVRVRVNPGDVIIKGVTLGMRADDGKISYQTIASDTLPLNTISTLDLPTDSWIDADDMANYPLHLSSMQFTMGAPTAGQEYTVDFVAFETIYSAIEPETYLLGDVNLDGNVDSGDVAAIVAIICGDAPYDDLADLNADGRVDSADLSMLVDIITQ